MTNKVRELEITNTFELDDVKGKYKLLIRLEVYPDTGNLSDEDILSMVRPAVMDLFRRTKTYYV